MAIIKQYHKDTDTTYVYDSASYWDAEKGQSWIRRPWKSFRPASGDGRKRNGRRKIRCRWKHGWRQRALGILKRFSSRN